MSPIISPMSIGSMSHVDFKKGLCRPVEFKGQGPPYYFHPHNNRHTSCDVNNVELLIIVIDGRGIKKPKPAANQKFHAGCFSLNISS